MIFAYNISIDRLYFGKLFSRMQTHAHASMKMYKSYYTRCVRKKCVLYQKSSKTKMLSEFFCQWIWIIFDKNEAHWALNSFKRHRFAQLEFCFAYCFVHVIRRCSNRHTHTYIRIRCILLNDVRVNVRACQLPNEREHKLFFTFSIYNIHYSIGNFLVFFRFFLIKLCWWFGFCFWFICWKMEMCLNGNAFSLESETQIHGACMHARTHKQALSI